jgi:hypothetical protein
MTTTKARSSSKKIQGKPRKKACISLFSLGRIGTFQWVTANPNKKIWPCFNSRLGLRAKRINVASVHYFWAPTYHIKISDIRQGKSIGNAQEDECSGLWLAPAGTCGVAMACNTIAFFIILIAIPCFCWRL